MCAHIFTSDDLTEIEKSGWFSNKGLSLLDWI